MHRTVHAARNNKNIVSAPAKEDQQQHRYNGVTAAASLQLALAMFLGVLPWLQSILNHPALWSHSSVPHNRQRRSDIQVSDGSA